jgi:oligoribonuclease (3'-5' exoribonuclease)
MKYFSIDLETTGLDPLNCQILEFAIAFRDTSEPFVRQNVKGFSAILKHKWIQGDAFALNMNADLIAKQVDRTVEKLTKSELNVQLRKFIEDCIGAENKFKLNVAGKNFQGFDVKFIEAQLDFDWLTFSHRVLDPAILYWDGISDRLPSLQECLDIAEIKKTVSHRALDDAIDVIELLALKGF